MQGDENLGVQWLDEEERATWLALTALTTLLPGALDAQLRENAGLTYFEYTVLAMLSESPALTMRMSDLAQIANGSLSRLSHVASRLETRGLIRRAPMPDDGRATVATLTDSGRTLVTAAAPGHVNHVRRIVLDQLSSQQQQALLSGAMRIVEALDPRAASIIAAGGLRAET